MARRVSLATSYGDVNKTRLETIVYAPRTIIFPLLSLRGHRFSVLRDILKSLKFPDSKIEHGWGERDVNKVRSNFVVR